MAILKRIKARSRRGERAIEALERRGSGVADRRLTKRVGRIVADVRRGGDRVLLDMIQRFDGVEFSDALTAAARFRAFGCGG